MSQENQEYLVKIVLAGDSGVGKTNVLSRFTRDFFSEDSKSTIGVEFATKNIIVNNKLVKASIWDTAGQENYKSITRAYFHGALGAMIIFDITQSTSFDSVSKWLKDVRDNAEKDAIVMMIGNKSDLAESRTVTEQEAVNFSRTEQLLYLETSALNSNNISAAFTTLVTEIVNNVSKKKALKPQFQNSLPLEEGDGGAEGVRAGIKITSGDDSKTENEKKDCC